ncbi:MAG: hypothetical protein GY832_39600 [Chloroflexi bacterium]|nr:hypothetical protein [Chloroflexota bacterium]
MAFLPTFDWQRLFELVNVILTSGIVIVSCALLLYLIIYNPRNDLGRSFAALLLCVMITYFVDLALFNVEDAKTATPWLRFQWVGIAFIPAAYLSFSNALLIMTGARSKFRKATSRFSYFLSTVLLLGVTFSNLVVRSGVLTSGAPHLQPGPFFPFFVIYFLTAVGWGVVNVRRAYQRCLTSISRRRMIYLAATFAAPAAGVFPYLLLTNWPASAHRIAFWSLLILGNVGVGLMLVLLSYSVAFFGALTADRAIKHRLVRFLLRGPLVATLVVVVIIVASQAEGWLGLPNRRVMIFGVVGVILFLQLGIELAKPLIDRALYRQDQPEIAWIQELSNRLLTTTDLRQFLENVLTALCDLLQVETTFIAVIDGGIPHLEVVCGPLSPGTADSLPPEAWQDSVEGNVSPNRHIERHGNIFVWDGYWLVPLRTSSSQNAKESTRGDVIGVIGIAARSPTPDPSPEEQAGMQTLFTQATAALEDRLLQQSIFSALERITPEIEDIQRRRGVAHYVGQEALARLSPAEDAEFRQWVRDALSHYWGGPKLTTSPLLSLHVVERTVQEYDGNVMKGFRAVLKQAIERLRPAGQRQMTAPEWILYNILELKFLQGRKVREIALRLAMSEADLYRKQRIAIEAVAQTLTEMEQEELNGQETDLEIT